MHIFFDVHGSYAAEVDRAQNVAQIGCCCCLLLQPEIRHRKAIFNGTGSGYYSIHFFHADVKCSLCMARLLLLA